MMFYHHRTNHNQRFDNPGYRDATSLLARMLSIRNQLLRGYTDYLDVVDRGHFNQALRDIVEPYNPTTEVEVSQKAEIIAVADGEHSNLFNFYRFNSNGFFKYFEFSSAKESGTSRSMSEPTIDLVDKIITSSVANENVNGFYAKIVTQLRVLFITSFDLFEKFLGIEPFGRQSLSSEGRSACFDAAIKAHKELIDDLKEKLTALKMRVEGVHLEELQKLEKVLAGYEHICNQMDKLRQDITVLHEQQGYDFFDFVLKQNLKQTLLRGSTTATEHAKLFHHQPRDPKNKVILQQLRTDLARLPKGEDRTHRHYRISTLCFEAFRKVEPINDNTLWFRMKQMLLALTIVGFVFKLLTTGSFNFNKRSATADILRQHTALPTHRF